MGPIARFSLASTITDRVNERYEYKAGWAYGSSRFGFDAPGAAQRETLLR
ncbi:MAG: hypothetical protein ABSB60_14305 [Terracidiphilus sp.]